MEPPRKRVKYFYPLALMVPGDSFFVPCLDTDYVQSEVRELAAAVGCRVQFREELSDGFYGLRVWRLT